MEAPTKSIGGILLPESSQSKLNEGIVLSVGPGYVDHNIRPWNTHNSRHRAHGHYYNDMWQKAMDANPDAMSVTSYNEWGEGTQIEPAAPSVASFFFFWQDELL